MERTARHWAVVVVLGALACGTTHDSHAPHWDYGKDGPGAWGMLSDQYRTCATGRKQSPIDLDPAHATHADRPPLIVHYTPTTVLELDNGHTIQDQVPPGELVELAGARFELEQFHFHHPSEHTLNGRHFPLEIHLVHRGERGKLLVVGVLVAEGAENPALRMLFEHLPHGAQRVKVATDPVALLPSTLGYLTYDGSLTTPPCTEGVTWLVLATPIEASAAQIAQFSAVFPNNSRPTVPRDRPDVRAVP
jgi:carbonic anhydrase